MPLRATLDGQDIVAGDLDEAAWATLKTRRDELRMPCCRASVIMRVSKLGLRHFAHRSRNVVCDWKPETEDHRRAKLAILTACRAAGWNAQPEAGAEDGTWRADVLAWREMGRGIVRVAFEVQLSAQSRSETEARQARYAAAQIRACWFIRPRRTTARFAGRNEHFADPSPDLPAFRLILEKDQPLRVAMPTGYSEDTDRIEPLPKFVAELLSKRVRFASHATNNVGRRIRAVFVPTGCWRCGAEGHYYYLDTLEDRADASLSYRSPRADCGRLLRSDWTSDALAPGVVNAITAYLRAHPTLPIRLGAIKERYSKTAGGRYLSFGCPACDALYGRNFLFDEISDYAQNGAPSSFPSVELDLPASGHSSPDPHWCHPASGVFCEHLAALPVSEP